MRQQRLSIYPMNVAWGGVSSPRGVWKRRSGIPLSQKALTAPGLPANRDGHAAPAADFPPTPERDLIYHGGRLLTDLEYVNLYLGGSSQWQSSDITHIDGALAAAMTDAHLNNVMVQYFPSGRISSTFLASHILADPLPAVVDADFLHELILQEFDRGTLDVADPGRTVFNLLLPRGTLLQLLDGGDDAVPQGEGASAMAPPEKAEEPSKGKAHAEAERAADSLHGLGGFHGAVHIPVGNGASTTIYFAAGVYSERDAQGRMNGIVAFDAPWKNVVATFYHELNEARTDADVDDVIATNNLHLWGWADAQGSECGDFPIAEAGADLGRVMQEVPLANGQGNVPVQFQYSNFAHGPEGPIPTPRPFSRRLAPGVVV